MPCALSGISTLWRAVAAIARYAAPQQAGQLALRAGRRLQADRVQPGDLGRAQLRAAQQIRARPGEMRRVLIGMQCREARQRRQSLVPLGVVLHRARAERIEAGAPARSSTAKGAENAAALAARCSSGKPGRSAAKFRRQTPTPRTTRRLAAAKIDSATTADETSKINGTDFSAATIGSMCRAGVEGAHRVTARILPACHHRTPVIRIAAVRRQTVGCDSSPLPTSAARREFGIVVAERTPARMLLAAPPPPSRRGIFKHHARTH